MSVEVAYYVHGRGRGHASRTLATLPRLREAGLSPRVFAAGDALSMLRSEPVSPVELSAPGPGMPRRFLRRLRNDLQVLRALRPALLVSDGDGPSVHAAFALGIPSLAISHGLIFGHCELPSGLPLRQVWRERLNAASASWPSRRRVAVHFAALEPRTAGTAVARPDLPAALMAASRSRGGFLLAYFRDGTGQRELRQLTDRGHRVICFGSPTERVPGVQYREVSAEGFAALLPRADGVVGSAGNHLPAECAMLGVPMLAFYRRDDAEHAMNARLIEHAGIGVAAAFGALEGPVVDRFERAMAEPHTELVAATRALAPASQVITSQCLAIVREASTGATPGSPPAPGQS